MTQRLNYMSHASDGMKALGGVHQYVGQSGLPKRLVDLVYLRVSLINGCAYCIDLHSRDLLALGVPVETLVLVPAWHEAGDLFSAEEKAALRWAEVVTRLGPDGVSDVDYDAVSAVFDEKARSDLTIAVALMNAYNRLAIPFRATPAAAKHRS